MAIYFERKLVILPVYELCPIYFDLTIDPNDPDEQYTAFMSTESLIWICHY